jgi:hypothetical protein
VVISSNPYNQFYKRGSNREISKNLQLCLKWNEGFFWLECSVEGIPSIIDSITSINIWFDWFLSCVWDGVSFQKNNDGVFAGTLRHSKITIAFFVKSALSAKFLRVSE